MSRTVRIGLVAAAMAVTTTMAVAAEGDEHIARQPWTFAGVRGDFDRAQLQRGFQVYREVCSTCHSLDRIYFRNLGEKGGPEFPEEGVKGLAAKYKIVDGPDDNGKMFKRPGRLSDHIPGPYDNEKQARFVNHGALPPDFSLLEKARKVETKSPFYMVPVNFLRDVFFSGGYQEGGADYIYAILNGYRDKPPAYKDEHGHMAPMTDAQAAADPTAVRCASVVAGEPGQPDTCNKMVDGMYYNTAFSGHQIAMPPPPIDDGFDQVHGRHPVDAR